MHDAVVVRRAASRKGESAESSGTSSADVLLRHHGSTDCIVRFPRIFRCFHDRGLRRREHAADRWTRGPPERRHRKRLRRRARREPVQRPEGRRRRMFASERSLQRGLHRGRHRSGELRRVRERVHRQRRRLQRRQVRVLRSARRLLRWRRLHGRVERLQQLRLLRQRVRSEQRPSVRRRRLRPERSLSANATAAHDRHDARERLVRPCVDLRVRAPFFAARERSAFPRRIAAE